MSPFVIYAQQLFFLGEAITTDVIEKPGSYVSDVTVNGKTHYGVVEAVKRYNLLILTFKDANSTAIFRATYNCQQKTYLVPWGPI